MSTVLNQNSSGAYLPTQHFNGALSGFLRGCLDFHCSDDTQENLVMLDNLALRDRRQQEKLARMSIHTEIKRRRDALGWSHQRLAEAVSAAEGLNKTLAWQTVQQWENGVSAPKRTRMPFVAQALGCSLVQLMSEDVKAHTVTVPTIASKPANTRSPPSKYVPSSAVLAVKQAKKGGK